MRYETMILGSNVIWFPVEMRAKPSIDLLTEIAPDLREVELVAEAFGFDAPDPEVREQGGPRLRLEDGRTLGIVGELGVGGIDAAPDGPTPHSPDLRRNLV